MEVLTYVGAFVAFVVIYEFIRRRSTASDGRRPPVQWGWLLAIVACAIAAIALGALFDV